MKILNLYAGIGGNRKLWSGDIEVTAIENNEKIAKIYQDFFPNDKVIVTDAHQYLLEHFKEFDFIWSSPPCPTHSRLRKVISMNSGAKAVYPDMKLYEEILFLMGYFKGKWVVENVRSWYEYLIKPYELERHYFWSNFPLAKINITDGKIELCNGYHKEDDKQQVDRFQKEFKFDLSKYKLSTMQARTMLRNCVNPKTGLHIFEMAFKKPQLTLQLNTKELVSIPPNLKRIGYPKNTIYMTKTIKGNLIIEKDTTFEEDLIVEGDITGKDGARYNLTVKGSLNCGDLNCGDLNCGDLKAKDVSYYAVCFAYNNIKCKSIKGRRKPCKEPFVLDGTIEVGK